MIKKSKRTHWISLFIDTNTAFFFDSFETEYFLEKIKKCEAKSKITQLLTRYLKCNLMILLCVDFIVSLSWNI